MVGDGAASNLGWRHDFHELMGCSLYSLRDWCGSTAKAHSQRYRQALWTRLVGNFRVWCDPDCADHPFLPALDCQLCESGGGNLLQHHLEHAPTAAIFDVWRLFPVGAAL